MELFTQASLRAQNSKSQSLARYGTVGFNVLLHTLQLISGQFYGSHDQANSIIALKDNG